MWYWQKNRNIDQWKRIQSPEINSLTTGQLTMTKEAKIYNEEDTVFSIGGAWKTGQLHEKE